MSAAHAITLGLKAIDKLFESDNKHSDKILDPFAKNKQPPADKKAKSCGSASASAAPPRPARVGKRRSSRRKAPRPPPSETERIESWMEESLPPPPPPPPAKKKCRRPQYVDVLDQPKQ